MPNFIKDMVNSVQNGDAVEFANQFDAQLKDNIAGNIETKRTDIAKSLFNKEPDND